MFTNFIQKHNLKKYRTKQILTHYYKEARLDWDDFTTLPKDIRKTAKKEIKLNPLINRLESISKDKSTIKILFERKFDKHHIETVLMKHKDGRNTICVSTMAGCPLNCSFCATGKMGYFGNLTSDEIVYQVLYFKNLLTKTKEKVTNIVFMGMGEPFLNLNEVLKSIEIITNPEKIGLSPRRLTISTAGIPEGIKKFADLDFQGTLAISLHNADQKQREKIMPIARKFKLETLREALVYYFIKTNKRISFEYILINKVTDKETDAENLVKFTKGLLVHINLIPYNPTPNIKFEPSKAENIQKFINILTKNKIPYTFRVSMGQDIDAACGQLAVKKNKKNNINIKISFMSFIISILLLFPIFYFYNYTDNPFKTIATTKTNDLPPFKKLFIQEKIYASYFQTNNYYLTTIDNKLVSNTCNFAIFDDNKISITPEVTDTQTCYIKISAMDKNNLIETEYQLQIIPGLSKVNFDKLRSDVINIIGEEDKDKYAITLIDLKRKKRWDINGEVMFFPGSISKVQIALIVLRDVDKGKFSLNAVSPNLVKMLNYSRNDAMMELDDLIGGPTAYNPRIRNELEVDMFFRMPHMAQSNDVAYVFQGIYEQRYLSKEMNDYLLSLLKNNLGYNTKLLLGYPQDIEIAHKTGWLGTAGGEAYNDATIVYGKETDFILVMLDKDTSRYSVAPKARDIAEVVYKTLNPSHEYEVMEIPEKL